MKLSKPHFSSRVYRIPEIKFEGQKLTSFAGLVVIQKFFQENNIKDEVQKCFRHLSKKTVVGFETVLLLLVINFVLGFKRIRDILQYKNDPIVLRTLGLKNIPSISTVSRTLAKCDMTAAENYREFSKKFVLNRLSDMALSSVTCDFDGSVLSTKRFAEGTAVGYNKKKKGLRSYYSLFATIAQTGQVLDIFHRPGNVHDSNGAKDFIISSFNSLREYLPNSRYEARLDSAFFSDKIVSTLSGLKVEFSISVPFERFPELKKMVEGRKRWKKLDDRWSYFTNSWSPDCWDDNYRFIFMRQKVKLQQKKPVQLDLFWPFEYGYDFKVIVTNKKTSVKNVLHFHNGRGYQENIFRELKDHCNLDYIPFKRKIANMLYHQSAVLCHNIFREIHMKAHPKDRGLTMKRSPLWIFKEVGTIRQKIINIAGRLTRHGGKLTLTLNGNEQVEENFLQFLAT